MNKKILVASLGVLGLLFLSPVLKAQSEMELGDINAILEDNSLREATTRFASVLAYFFPEEASRLGVTAGNSKLNNRSAESEEEALQALHAVQDNLKQVDPRRLSENKRVEYTLLANAIGGYIWNLQQNRLAHNPLYYTQALDALYDLTLIPATDQRKHRKDLLSRISMLPALTAQAQQNLTDVSPYLARLAMEKSYYAYLSFDDIAKSITTGIPLSNDEKDIARQENDIRRAKAAVKQLFDLFKQLSQLDSSVQDFRLGKDTYAGLLHAHYQITTPVAELDKHLSLHFDQAQHRLFERLLPFQLSAEEEEITVVEDLNEIPQIKPAETKPAKKTKSKDNKPAYVPPTANQFYAVADQLLSPFTLKTLREDFAKQAATFTSRLLQQKLIPQSVSLKINPLPQYFAYQQEFLLLPAHNIFFLRLPFGNQLAQQQMLQRDFNEPATKLLISQEVVPGRLYQNTQTKSRVRRILGSALLANGWTHYALRLARQQGYFLTDEEELFFAWQEYMDTLGALLDERLQTKKLTYDEAVNFLTQTNGFTQEQAIALLGGLLRNPGQAVSVVLGSETWEKAAASYQKKWKDTGKVVALLLQVGNVAPQDLEAELKRLAGK